MKIETKRSLKKIISLLSFEKLAGADLKHLQEELEQFQKHMCIEALHNPAGSMMQFIKSENLALLDKHVVVDRAEPVLDDDENSDVPALEDIDEDDYAVMPACG